MKEDGYPDVQAFMATYREAEAVVEQYNRSLAEWERKAQTTETARKRERQRQAQAVAGAGQTAATQKEIL